MAVHPGLQSTLRLGRGYWMARLEVKTACDRFLEGPENANEIVTLLEASEGDDKRVVAEAVKQLSRACQHTLKIEGYPKLIENEGLGGESSDPEEEYCAWIRGKYHACKRRLLELVSHPCDHVKELSLVSFMKLLIGESSSVCEASSQPYHFPMSSLQLLPKALLDTDTNMRGMIERFSEYLEYDDIRLHMMKAVRRAITLKLDGSQAKVHDIRPSFVSHTFELLRRIRMPESAEDIGTFIAGSPVGAGLAAGGSRKSRKRKASKTKTCQPHDVTVLVSHRQCFSELWLSFLRLPLSSGIYKQVLTSIHDSVIPHMLDPKKLIDFMTDSYNLGGVISLLALNGLFVLIHKHNLDYPDFYTKLYALLDHSVFHVKYCTRFFRLLDLFLTSTHLPAYLVAAFIKRIGRLTLTAPPSGIILAIPFICNLMKRHPSCTVLIHRSGDCKAMDSDPYQMEEVDPAKSHAFDSSLWEIQTMKSHYLPAVASLVSLLEKPLNKVEHNVEKYMDHSYMKLFQESLCHDSEDQSRVALSHRQPESLTTLGTTKGSLPLWTW